MSRVVLVGKGPPDRGGISAFLSGLMTSDLTVRHRVRLLNLTRDEVPRSGRLSAGNVTRTLRDVGLVFRASRDADIVHVHTALVPHVTLVRAGLLALAARLRGARPIVHAHSGKVQRWLTTPARGRLARAALAPAARVVAVSQGGRDALASTTGRRVDVIENGVDVRAFTAARPHNRVPRVLFAGVLTPRKGVVDLLDASRRLSARGVAHEVVLVGGAPDEGPEAEREVRVAAEGAPVRFLGPQPHEAMPAIYAAADVYCLPSWWEAMPLSVLEAMACGLPVVATRVGDVPRAVEDTVTGLLVPAGEPDALADALEPLLCDADARTAMGRAGRRRAERLFDLAATARAVDELYRQLA